MVAEDGEGVGGEGASGDVHAHGGEFTCDLVHVGDHQQQTLGSREGGGEGSALKGTVHGSGGTPFGLHLDHIRGGSPDVLAAFGRPFITVLRHGRRRRDGINGDVLNETISDGSRCFVAVEDAGVWVLHFNIR